jgi:hypothetical protein
MAEKFVGHIVMTVDGREIEVVSFNANRNTGKKPVATMNRKKRISGHAEGLTTYELSLEVAIPLDGSEPDWAAIEDAKITLYPEGHDDQRESYLGCACTSVSAAYRVDGEAVRSLSMFALDYVRE